MTTFGLNNHRFYRGQSWPILAELVDLPPSVRMLSYNKIGVAMLSGRSAPDEAIWSLALQRFQAYVRLVDSLLKTVY